MSNQTSTTPARYGSATTVRTRNAKGVGRLRRQRVQMLMLSAAVAASIAACGNGAAKPANPPPMPVAQTGAAVKAESEHCCGQAASAKQKSQSTPKPTASRPTHATVTGPRLYN
jgi:hypothetical protein